MGMAEYGDQTVALTIITCWHTTAAAILVLLQVVDITISEITWYTTGVITVPMVVRNNAKAMRNLTFLLSTWWQNYFKPGPATHPGKVTYRIVNPSSRNKADDFGKWYVAENVVHGNPGGYCRQLGRWRAASR